VVWLGQSAWAQGQNPTVLRLLDYDTKKIHYGFQIGLFTSNLNIRHSDFFANAPEISDSTIAIRPNRTSSFSLGFIINKSLADDLWDLRFLPKVSFYTHSMDFIYPNSQNRQLADNTLTFLEAPVLFKYRSLRRKNFRLYMVGGLTPGLSVGARRGDENPRDLNLRGVNLEVTYGFGLDGYMQLFSFAPEIRFSHGLVNMLKNENNRFSNNLDRIVTHKVGLYFNFEG
jgi:hypothetical protein